MDILERPAKDPFQAGPAASMAQGERTPAEWPHNDHMIHQIEYTELLSELRI